MLPFVPLFDRLMPGTYPPRRGIRRSRLDGRVEVGRIGVSGASDQTNIFRLGAHNLIGAY